jgi:hypothetical protein
VVPSDQAPDAPAVRAEQGESAETAVLPTATGPQGESRTANVAVDLARERQSVLGGAPVTQTAAEPEEPLSPVRVSEGGADPAAPAAADVPVPALAEMLAAGVPFDALGLGSRLDEFLQQLDALGEELGLPADARHLPAWVLAAGLAVGACEVARRYYRRAGALAAQARAADTLSWSLSLSDPKPLRD